MKEGCFFENLPVCRGLFFALDSIVGPGFLLLSSATFLYSMALVGGQNLGHIGWFVHLIPPLDAACLNHLPVML